jgi:hypothetical protein
MQQVGLPVTTFHEARDGRAKKAHFDAIKTVLPIALVQAGVDRSRRRGWRFGQMDNKVEKHT